jgi:FtsP/CotA-like multicopper oxidase with cupredoxin domain
MVLQTILYDTNGELNQIAALFPDPSPCPTPNPGTWQCSKRQVTINGQIRPVITMRPGEVQRWRLIDSGFRESFALRLEGHALYEIALDGLYLGRVDTWPAGSGWARRVAAVARDATSSLMHGDCSGAHSTSGALRCGRASRSCLDILGTCRC